jgi:type IX secretion system PorP/SprF family membrane protein
MRIFIPKISIAFGALLSTLTLQTQTVQAQDTHFSQVLMTPQLSNPALTGMFGGGYRVFLNYRTQWNAVNSPYVTYAGTFDTKLFKKKKDGGYMGFGLNIVKDAAGAGNFGLMQFDMNLSAVLPIADNQTASAGLAIGGGQYSVNMNSLTWGNQWNYWTIDPTLPSGEADALTSFVFYDVGAGVNYRYSNVNGKFVGEDKFEFDLGAAYYHVNKPDQFFVTSTPQTLESKLVIRFQMRKDVKNTTVGFVPFGQFVTQGPHQEINGGLLMRFKLKDASKRTDIFAENAFMVGVQYRSGAAIVPQFYVELRSWMVGFAYDYNISSLADAGAANGGFEISIRYINFNEPRISTKSRAGKARL